MERYIFLVTGVEAPRSGAVTLTHEAFSDIGPARDRLEELAGYPDDVVPLRWLVPIEAWDPESGMPLILSDLEGVVVWHLSRVRIRKSWFEAVSEKPTMCEDCKKPIPARDIAAYRRECNIPNCADVPRICTDCAEKLETGAPGGVNVDLDYLS